MTYNISIFVSGRAISPFSNQFLAFFCFVCCVLLDFVPFFAPHSLFFGLLRADLCMNTLWSLNDCPKLLWPSSFCIIFFRAETSSHRNFCTQHHIRTQIFTRRNFPHQTGFSHQRGFRTETLLHTNFFTHRCYTEKFSRSDPLPHIGFYTQKLLHAETFTHGSSYTEQILHGADFTQ